MNLLKMLGVVLLILLFCVLTVRMGRIVLEDWLGGEDGD